MVSHRKQGSVLPTLSIQISPDPATDKLRKRRSSRTAGLTTTRDSGPTTLWFRLGEDHTYTLTDWVNCIRNQMQQPSFSDRHPISPVSPVSPTFINPFPPQPSDRSQFTRSSSGNTYTRSTLQHKSSTHTYGSSQNQRTMYSSGTPSLRSLESDVSSTHANSGNTGQIGYQTQQYTSVRPTDLPSPAMTVGGYHEEFIEGWTSAQGRSSTLSSPIRGPRESIGSVRGHLPLGSNSSSPPGPRETILDRAFQLRYIPGSEREVPGEEKLTSLARFDALMRDAEERRLAQERERDAAIVRQAKKGTLKSAWEDDTEDDGRVNKDVDTDEESDYDGFDHGMGYEGEQVDPGHKALESIASRRSSVQAPRPRHMSRNSLSYHESQPMTGGSQSILRPHTAHSKSRPLMSPRATSQPQPVPPSLDRLTLSTMPPTGEGSGQRHEKRNSITSVKRLSFNEFTKRLSSTSSLLLVQTNQSTTSSRGSSELEGGVQQPSTPRGGLNPRGTPLSPNQDRDERCGWRGSVGVFGDGGFV